MHKPKLLLANISKIKEFHNIHVEIIIRSLKQNNLHLSYPSNMQIISQEQLNVDIFSGHGQASLILLPNVHVCPNPLYSNAGFSSNPKNQVLTLFHPSHKNKKSNNNNILG